MEKAVKKLEKMYPEINWKLITPDEHIIETYGDGVILEGERGGKMKQFFILKEDKRKEEWGHVIATELNQGV